MHCTRSQAATEFDAEVEVVRQQLASLEAEHTTKKEAVERVRDEVQFVGFHQKMCRGRGWACISEEQGAWHHEVLRDERAVRVNTNAEV